MRLLFILIAALAATYAQAADWKAAVQHLDQAVVQLGQAAEALDDPSLLADANNAVQQVKQAKQALTDKHLLQAAHHAGLAAHSVADLLYAVAHDQVREHLANAWVQLEGALHAAGILHNTISLATDAQVNEPMTSCATRCSHTCGGGFWGALDVASCISHCPEGCPPHCCGTESCCKDNLSTCEAKE